MNTIASEIRTMAQAVGGWLCHEPTIRPDFRAADYLTTAAIIAVVIGKGINRSNAIHAYLDGRECTLDVGAVQFILDAFDGGDRRHCVWQRSKGGRYTLLD